MLARLTRRLGWSPFALDAAFAAAMLAVGELTEWLGPHSTDRAASVGTAMVVLSAGLTWRRRAPLLTVAALVVAIAILSALTPGSPSIWFLVTLLVTVYSAAAHLPAREARWAGVLAFAAVEVSTFFDPTSGTADKWTTALVLVGAPWIGGRALRRQRRQALELADVNARLQLERDERAREAVAAERVRIARDLHDVIAHSVSVMIVQAGAAEQVLDADPERVREPLQAIRATGKAALDDMRRLLGVLRTEAGDAGLAPQPSLRDIDALAEHFTAAGLPVAVAVDGPRRTLAPGVEMTAYRVCQEALTNSLKHGGGDAALTLRFAPDAVEVAVVDSGAGRPSPGAVDGGHGLVGMRERVAVYGGQLRAGHRAGGGFAVEARLPCASEPAALLGVAAGPPA